MWEIYKLVGGRDLIYGPPSEWQSEYTVPTVLCPQGYRAQSCFRYVPLLFARGEGRDPTPDPPVHQYTTPPASRILGLLGPLSTTQMGY